MRQARPAFREIDVAVRKEILQDFTPAIFRRPSGCPKIRTLAPRAARWVRYSFIGTSCRRENLCLSKAGVSADRG